MIPKKGCAGTHLGGEPPAPINRETRPPEGGHLDKKEIIKTVILYAFTSKDRGTSGWSSYVVCL